MRCNAQALNAASDKEKSERGRMKLEITIRPETSNDIDAITKITVAAFRQLGSYQANYFI